MLHALAYCRQKITEQGELSSSTINVLRKWGGASQFQISSTIVQSAAILLPVTALMDALNPCSLFCFAAFLAFLWLYPTRKWLQFSLGLIFILTLGVVHYLQQVQTAIYYQFVPKLNLAVILTGILLLLSAFNHFRKMMSRVSTKPGILVFVVLILTVFAVQTYQQTCIFNVGLVLEQWLAEQTLSPVRYHLYHVIYQLIYLLPLAFLLIFTLIYGRHQRMVGYQKMLKIAACLILLSIGTILIVYPQVLSSLWISFVVLLVSICVGWVVGRFVRE